MNSPSTLSSLSFNTTRSSIRPTPSSGNRMVIHGGNASMQVSNAKVDVCRLKGVPSQVVSASQNISYLGDAVTRRIGRSTRAPNPYYCVHPGCACIKFQCKNELCNVKIGYMSVTSPKIKPPFCIKTEDLDNFVCPYCASKYCYTCEFTESGYCKKHRKPFGRLADVKSVYLYKVYYSRSIISEPVYANELVEISYQSVSGVVQDDDAIDLSNDGNIYIYNDKDPFTSILISALSGEISDMEYVGKVFTDMSPDAFYLPSKNELVGNKTAYNKVEEDDYRVVLNLVNKFSNALKHRPLEIKSLNDSIKFTVKNALNDIALLQKYLKILPSIVANFVKCQSIKRRINAYMEHKEIDTHYDMSRNNILQTYSTIHSMHSSYSLAHQPEQFEMLEPMPPMHSFTEYDENVHIHDEFANSRNIQVVALRYPIPDGIESICNTHSNIPAFAMLMGTLRKSAFSLEVGFNYIACLAKRANDMDLGPLNKQITELSEEYKHRRATFNGFHGSDVKCYVPRTALKSDRVLKDLVKSCPTRVHESFGIIEANANPDDVIIPTGLNTSYFPQLSDICVYDPAPNPSHETQFETLRSTNTLFGFYPYNVAPSSPIITPSPFTRPPFLNSNLRANHLPQQTTTNLNSLTSLRPNSNE